MNADGITCFMRISQVISVIGSFFSLVRTALFVMAGERVVARLRKVSSHYVYFKTTQSRNMYHHLHCSFPVILHD